MVSINDYLVALNRIARPDVVFRLWGHMKTLFEMCPGARTLSMGWPAVGKSRMHVDFVSGWKVANAHRFRQRLES